MTERDESLKGRGGEIQLLSRKSSFPALRRRCSSTQNDCRKTRERSAGGPVHILDRDAGPPPIDLVRGHARGFVRARAEG